MYLSHTLTEISVLDGPHQVTHFAANLRQSLLLPGKYARRFQTDLRGKIPRECKFWWTTTLRKGLRLSVDDEMGRQVDENR